MAQLTIKSQGDYYTDYQVEVQDDAPELTDFTDGSTNDILGGVFSTGLSEITALIIDQFKKLFFTTAGGPETTGGPDDIQTLAVDHYGTDFARPAATSAIGDVTFTRPTDTAGAGTILAGTIVKTPPDSSGVSQRAALLQTVTVGPTTLTINASAQMVVPGQAGNVSAAMITQIEGALFDPTFVVSNTLGFAGGAAALSTPDYQEFIRNSLETLKGGTVPGIEALAKKTPGVEIATVVENEIAVRQWDIGSNSPTGPTFRIPQTTLYIADANGSASDALVAQVLTGLFALRAAGVQIDVAGATALPVNWTASIVLNPAGPNFSILENDATMIIDTMKAYLNVLPIGMSFIRRDARNVILAIWGPSGTNDITDFLNHIPVGDVQADEVEKLKPGTVGLS